MSSTPQSSSREDKSQRHQNNTISSHRTKDGAPASSPSPSSSRSARFARSLRFKKKKETAVVTPVENAETGNNNNNDNHNKSVKKSKNRLRALSHRIMHPVKHSKKKKKKKKQQQNNGGAGPVSSSSLAAEVDEEEEEEDVTSSSETNPNKENSSAGEEEEEEEHAVETNAMGGSNHEEEDYGDVEEEEEEEEEPHVPQPVSVSVLSRAAFSDNEDAIEKDRGHLGFGNHNGDSDDDSDDDDDSDSSDEEERDEKDDSNSNGIHEDDRIVLSQGKAKKCDKKQFKKKKKGKKNALKKKVHKSDEILFPGDNSKHKKKNKKDAKKSDKKLSLNDPEELNRLESFMNKQLMNGPQFGDSLLSGEAKRPSDFADNSHTNRGDSNARTVEEILMLQDYSDFYDRPDANPTYVYSENDDAAKSIIRQHLMKPPNGAQSQPSSLSSLPVPEAEHVTTQTTPKDASL